LLLLTSYAVDTAWSHPIASRVWLAWIQVENLTLRLERRLRMLEDKGIGFGHFDHRSQYAVEQQHAIAWG
jgi:hypothetical protein